MKETKSPELSPYHKKQAHVLYENAERFIKTYGVKRVGFLTLTFKDNVTDYKEAGRRFNNLNRRFLSKYFGEWCLVKEVQKRGAWHYHILVDCLSDIKTGFDFDSYVKSMDIREEQYKAGKKWSQYKNLVLPFENKYKDSASVKLRQIWRLLNETLKKYGFGRSELLPIRKSAQAAAQYCGKYISSHIGSRTDKDKGVRLFSSSKGFKVKSCTKFQWHTDNSKKWRKNVSILADYLDCKNINELSLKLGPKWAFTFQDLIFDIEMYPKDVVLNFAEIHLRQNPIKLISRDLKAKKKEEEDVNFVGATAPPKFSPSDDLERRSNTART